MYRSEPVTFSRRVNSPFLFVIVSGLLITAVFILPGCSKKKTNTETANQSESTETAEDEKTDQPPATDVETVMAQSLFQLMKQAETQNASGEFDAAFQTWKTIHEKVSSKYGVDGWQTVSAELAMSAARQRTKMSKSDRELAAELAKLTAAASQSIGKQNYNEARIDIEKAASISTRLWGKESYVSANVNFERARCYLGLGMQDRAIAVLNDVLNLRISLTGINHPDVESTLEMVAKANSALKNHLEAKQANEKLVAVTGHLWGEQGPAYANRCNELAVSLSNSGEPGLALQWFEKALSIRTKEFGDDSLAVGHVLMNRGIAQLKLKSFKTATEDLEGALSIFAKEKLDVDDPNWPLLYDQLGTLALLEKRNEDGQKYFSRLADYWKEKEDENHLEYGKSLYKLSVSIGNQGHYKDAEPIMKKAISIFETKLGYSNKMLHQPLSTYARLLEKMGVQQEAKKIKDRAVRLAGFQELPN